jgi:hypothetical protein
MKAMFMTAGYETMAGKLYSHSLLKDLTMVTCVCSVTLTVIFGFLFPRGQLLTLSLSGL